MIISRGAEAVIHKKGNVIIKDRISKTYRLKQLDQHLRVRRTRSEARLMREARRAGILTPQILEESKTAIKMQHINGKRIKDILNKNNYRRICKNIGLAITKLHKYNIIHGDLTTSNIIITKGAEQQLFFIDFGLGFHSSRIEDKAVDIRLLQQALISTHSSIADKCWKQIIKSYKNKDVLNRIKTIDKRRRYKGKE
jgi:Kae1-associated kinase Bud32